MVDMILYGLGWPKMSFGFFHKSLWKNLNFLANLIEYPKESVKKKKNKNLINKFSKVAGYRIKL